MPEQLLALPRLRYLDVSGEGGTVSPCPAGRALNAAARFWLSVVVLTTCLHRPHPLPCVVPLHPPALTPSAESWFDRSHLETALPRLTLLTSLALDKCELPGQHPPVCP